MHITHTISTSQLAHKLADVFYLVNVRDDSNLNLCVRARAEKVRGKFLGAQTTANGTLALLDLLRRRIYKEDGRYAVILIFLRVSCENKCQDDKNTLAFSYLRIRTLNAYDSFL